MQCGMGGTVPAYINWTLTGMTELYNALNSAASMTFGTTGNEIKPIYTIDALDMGWEEHEDGTYKFNTNNIKLNVSENNMQNNNNGSKSGIVTQPFTKLILSLWGNYETPSESKDGWAETAGNTSYNLYSVESTSKQSTANTEILTDTRNETYYILLEKNAK